MDLDMNRIFVLCDKVSILAERKFDSMLELALEMFKVNISANVQENIKMWPLQWVQVFL